MAMASVRGVLVMALLGLMGVRCGGAAEVVGEVPIPELERWEKNMVAYGTMHRDERAKGIDESAVWYYDGQRVFYQIADYTKDPKWNEAARNSEQTYRAYAFSGNTPGWRVFPHGLYQDFKRTGDEKSKAAVIQLAKSSAFAWAGGGQDPRLSRETAYILMAYLLAEDLGLPKHPMRDRAAEYALGHIDQWFTSKKAGYVQPFMVGLTCEALIQYYEKTKDRRVPPAIKVAADWLWGNAWVARDQAFWYISMDPYNPRRKPERGAPDLNLLIAPAYAWLYLQTGDTRYRDWGDRIFAGGVRRAWLGDGKQFSQSYRWSFDYVKWRRDAERKRVTGRPR